MMQAPQEQRRKNSAARTPLFSSPISDTNLTAVFIPFINGQKGISASGAGDSKS
jgi:hypothetical protein